MTAVTIDSVRKTFGGTQVLHGLDLAFEEGEFVVIVGPSGCGKSTLLRMIAGLESISDGLISIGPEVVNDLDPVDRGCAMVFQNYALYPHMTVAENIAYPLRIARVPRPERAERVREVASVLGLTDYLDRRPKQLSGGQRQRVAMGRAIVRKPKVFLFDEPLSNLDAKMRLQMRIELRRLHRQLGVTSILVTHDQVEAMTMADRLVVMNGGRVEQTGTPSDVYARPASTFVAGFLGSPPMNLLTAQVAGPGHVTFDAAPGHMLTVPFDLPTGTSLTVGIRPEDMVATVGDGPGIPAMIDLVEDLGGQRIAYCVTGEASVAVVLPKDKSAREGNRVFLTAPADRIHTFDIGSGRQLSAPKRPLPPRPEPIIQLADLQI